MKFSKAIAIVLIIGMVALLTACGKISEKVAQKGIEKMLESQIGEDVDITDSGLKIGNKDEGFELGDDLEWPKDKMGDLPEPAGKVTFVMKASTGCSVTVGEITKDEIKDYVEKIKDLGYEVIVDAEANGIYLFKGKKDNTSVSLQHEEGSEEAAIIYALEDEEAENAE